MLLLNVTTTKMKKSIITFVKKNTLVFVLLLALCCTGLGVFWTQAVQTGHGGREFIEGEVQVTGNVETEGSFIVKQDMVFEGSAPDVSLYEIFKGGASGAPTVPAAFADALIFRTNSLDNPSKMSFVFWNGVTDRPSLTLNQGLAGRATVFDRSLIVGKGLGASALNTTYTECDDEAYIYADCDTSTTGADFIVEDDVEITGSTAIRESLYVERELGAGEKTPVDKIHISGGKLRIDNDAGVGGAGCIQFSGTEMQFSNDCSTFSSFSSMGNTNIVTIKKTAAQSIDDMTWTDITFAGEDIDTDNLHSTTVNNARITFTEDGIYQVSAQVGWESKTDKQYNIRIYKNGTTELYQGHTISAKDNFTFTSDLPARFFSFVATDYITLQGYQDAASTRDVLDGTETHLSVMKVGNIPE